MKGSIERHLNDARVGALLTRRTVTHTVSITDVEIAQRLAADRKPIRVSRMRHIGGDELLDLGITMALDAHNERVPVQPGGTYLFPICVEVNLVRAMLRYCRVHGMDEMHAVAAGRGDTTLN